MHYSGIVAVVALTATGLLAFPLGNPRLVTADAIARSVDDLVKRDPSLDFKDDKIYYLPHNQAKAGLWLRSIGWPPIIFSVTPADADKHSTNSTTTRTTTSTTTS